MPLQLGNNSWPNVPPVIAQATVEIQCADTSTTKYTFRNQEIIQDMLILGVETFDEGDLTIYPPSQRAVVNATVFNKTTLSLKVRNSIDVDQVPLFTYHRADNGGNLPFFYPRALNLDQCSINIASAASLSASESFIFLFYYADPRNPVHMEALNNLGIPYITGE